MAARVVSIQSSSSLLPGPHQAGVFRVLPRSRDEKLEQFSLSELRRRVRQNRVSFPSQVPVFAKHDRPDVQRKAVQLYFLFGWSCKRIAERYGLLRQRVQQILSTWKLRAIQMGYIQQIPPAAPLPKTSSIQ